MIQLAPLQTESSDAETELRNQAINQYIAGKQPAEICRQLGRSRTWFYDTLNRYRAAGREGLRSRSRAPHRVHNRTSEELEAAIERVRKLIVEGQDPELRYANRGATAIAAELKRTGITPPSRATITRILNRRNLAQPRPPRSRAPRLPRDYPWVHVQQPNQLHLLDFVARCLVGGEHVIGYHLLDQARRWPYLAAEATKNRDKVSKFPVAAWQEIGLPQALHIDNDVVWRGSGSAARTFSYIVRLCLYLGVEVIFTPPYTPQANPVIESFNNVWNHNFWQRESFLSLLHVHTCLPVFQRYCRERRPLPEFADQFAVQLYPDFVPVCLAADFVLPDRLPLTAGRLHFIRFVSHQGTFSLLNEAWPLDADEWAGKVIRATLLLEQQQLHVYYQKTVREPAVMIKQFDYTLSEPVRPLDPAFQRPTLALWPETEAFHCKCKLCAEPKLE